MTKRQKMIHITTWPRWWSEHFRGVRSRFRSKITS